MNIKTNYDFPPIPIRSMDWSAWDDNKGADCSPVGHGATEQEAIDNLMTKVEVTGMVACLKCGEPMHYTKGTCPHCGYVEFKDEINPRAERHLAECCACNHGKSPCVYYIQLTEGGL